jgi:hypothetical protein
VLSVVTLQVAMLISFLGRCVYFLSKFLFQPIRNAQSDSKVNTQVNAYS